MYYVHLFFEITVVLSFLFIITCISVMFLVSGKELTEEAKDRILEMLLLEEISGRDIQDRLIEEGLMKKESRGVHFYNAMVELEDRGLVKYEYEEHYVGGVEMTIRMFSRMWSYD